MSLDTAGRDDRSPESDIKLLDRAIAVLSEHFDTVQVFVSREIADGSTVTVNRGQGNYFARYGQASCWVDRQRADIRVQAAKEAEEEP